MIVARLYRILISDPVFFGQGYDVSHKLAEMVRGMWAELGAQPDALCYERLNDLFHVFRNTPFGPGSALGFRTLASPDDFIKAATKNRTSRREEPYDWIMTEADYQLRDGLGLEALKELKRNGITFGSNCAVTLLYSKNPDTLLARDRSEQARAEEFAAYVVSPAPEACNGDIYGLVGRVITRHHQGINPAPMFEALAQHATSANGQETKLRIHA